MARPCVMCGKNCDIQTKGVYPEAHHMPIEIALKTRPAIEQCDQLLLHGIGEPLTCPHLFEIASWAKPGTNISFCTNGRLLNKENIRLILESNITSIDVSLDATTRNTYSQIRRGDYSAVVCNIFNLVNERNRIGKKTPIIYLNMTLMRANVKDVPGLVVLAKAIGDCHAYVSHLNDSMDFRSDGWFDYKKQHCSLEASAHDAYIEEAERLAGAMSVDFEVRGERRLAK